MRLYRWLIPIAALLALTPLILGGPSCGKDSVFHFQSWLDAAAQLRHGTLYPRWNFLAAYNAGEPRFVFYPPISWYLGCLLTLVLPFQAVPAALAWVSLTISGFAMYRLASRWASPAAALIAACFYLANPFLLFSLLARSAYGELFAAAFCPWLIAAALDPEPTVWSMAFPLALMWLSNVPGGVIGTYLLALIAAMRIVTPLRSSKTATLHLIAIFTGGFIGAFALSAIFLLPAIHQKSFIHLTAAFRQDLRVTDNLLLQRKLIPIYDGFLIQIEHLALGLLFVTAVALAIAWMRSKRPQQGSVITTAILAAILAFLLTAFSAPLWRTLPDLWLVQFPWRLLFVLAICCALAIALALRKTTRTPVTAASIGLLLVLALAVPFTHLYRFGCSPLDTALGIRTRLLNHHSFEPTDEYVVATADAGYMRPDNPPYWLAARLNDYAPGTTPNLANVSADAEMPAVPDNAKLEATVLHFTINATSPAYAVVNLQDYPNWRVTVNRARVNARPQRLDGMLSVSIPAGSSTIDIHWHHTWDEVLGTLITAATLLLWCITRRRRAV